jgi:hypothetical protein
MNWWTRSNRLLGFVSSMQVLLCACSVLAADVTFYSYSDIHYGADNGGKSPPKTRSEKVDIINSLPGVAYPDSVGGTVDKPRAIIMQGDLINDGAVADKYPTQWANYIADFGVNGEGRCKFPVFEGLGNHDANENLYVFNKIKERTATRKSLNYIGNVSSNGFHYSWDWDGVHFVNLNLFGGNVWEGEADAYGMGHHPHGARDFLVDDLVKNVGNSGRPVVVVQHFRPVDENWWTYSAADKFHKVIQDYNVILILVGHQGGGVNNTWRGINWVSSNGDLVVLRISPDNKFTAIDRSAKEWGTPFQKSIFLSYETSGLPAVVNNGDWVSAVSASGATLSGKLLYAAESPTRVKVYWGPTDGGSKAEAWQNSKEVGEQKVGTAFSLAITGLKPYETNYYRCCASNGKGSAWAVASIPFTTQGILPSGWQTTFVGYEQRPWGGAHFQDGTLSVKGSGRDIGERGERSDHFQFAYRELEGDGEFVARIATMPVRSREPKAGIMLRESLEMNARHVSVLLGAPGGMRLFARKAAAGATSISRSDGTKAPCWAKLVRKANVFTGFTSADGSTWTQVGEPVTLDLPAKLFAGMAVTAGNRDGSRHHVSEFDHVTINGTAPGE